MSHPAPAPAPTPPLARRPAPAPSVGGERKILALILLLAAGVRLHDIGRQSLWFDEAATVHIIRQPLGRMFELIESDERTPPLHYLLLHFWIQLFGDSEISLRLPSAIAGVAAVFVLYRLVRALLGPGAGLVAGYIFAIDRYQIAYSQEARAYELMVLAGLVSTCLFVRIMRQRASRAPAPALAPAQAAYAVVTALLLYCHLYGIFVLAAHHVAWALERLRRRPALSPRRSARPRRSALSPGRWALLNLAVLALFSPWIRISIRWARDVQQSFWIPPVHPLDLWMTYRAYAGSTAMLILLAGAALMGLRRAARRGALALLASLALLPVVVPIAVSILTRPTFTPRYGLIASAGWIGVAAGGIMTLRNLPLRAGTLAAITFFAAVATLPPVDKPPWRQAGAWLERHMKSTDIAVISRKNTTYLYDYYVHRADVRRFGFDGSAIPVTLPLPPGQHVWLILQANVEPRAAILARGGWKVLNSNAFDGVEILELTDASDASVGRADPPPGEIPLRLQRRRLLPTLGVFGRLKNQLEHRPAFFDAVDGAPAFAQDIGEMADFLREGFHRREITPGGLLGAARQVINRIAGSEDLAGLAHDVNVMGAVRQRERPTREDFADHTVGEAHLNRGGILALDGLNKTPHLSVNAHRRRAGEVQQPIRGVIAGIDQLSAALRLEVRAPGTFEGAGALAAGAEAVLAAQPHDAPDFAGVDHSLGFLDDGHEQLVVAGHVRHAGFADRACDLIGLGERHAHGFFAEDVLARRRGIQDGRRVQVVRQADIDGIDFGAHFLEHDLPVIELPSPAARRRELLAALFQIIRRHIAQGDDLDLVGMLEKSPSVSPGDSAGADQSHAHDTVDFRSHC
jgi:hypothetical protein